MQDTKTSLIDSQKIHVTELNNFVEKQHKVVNLINSQTQQIKVEGENSPDFESQKKYLLLINDQITKMINLIVVVQQSKLHFIKNAENSVNLDDFILNDHEIAMKLCKYITDVLKLVDFKFQHAES